MTGEEATKILGSLFLVAEVLKIDKEKQEEIKDALNMAIKALQFQDIMINNPKTAKPTPEVCKSCKDNKQDNWIPVSEGLPEPCADVRVTCEVRCSDGIKRKYQSIAQWIPKNCEEALGINWDVEATEYNEEKDEYYPLEGWYESIKNWDEYSLVAISDFVIAWMPLSEPYKGGDKE